MDADGRHESPESETVDSLLLTAVAIARVSEFLQFLNSNSHMSIHRKTDDTSTLSGLWYMEGPLNLRKLNFFITGSQHACPLPQRETFLISQGCFLYKHS